MNRAASIPPSQVFLHVAMACALAAFSAWAAPLRGRLANPGFVNHRIKATYFFTGQALDGSNWHGVDPPPPCNAPNCCNPPNCPNRTYSLHPVDPIQLKWSESVANASAALDGMLLAGINVIHMSSWGDDVSSAWVTGAAPMQTSPKSHDELFDAAANRPLLIVPFLEERAGAYPWSFKNEFPTTPDGQIAPGTISQIEYLVRHYLQSGDHPQWSNSWARVYDRTGQERFAVGIIHAASNRLGNGGDDNASFAAGFDAVAEQVRQDTQVKIGFFIDALPWGTYADASFYPSSNGTGPALAATDSVLAVACFVPEVYLHSGDTQGVLNWKRQWSQGWSQSGVPFLMDVSSGYDGRVVFNVSWYYGLDQPSFWLCSLDQMVRDFGQSGIVFNSWNGYTEGMVAVPTTELGSLFFGWLQSLQAADVYAKKPDAPSPRDGTWCRPYTLPEAIQNVLAGGNIGLVATTTTPFDAPLLIAKPCTIRALGGNALIGH